MNGCGHTSIEYIEHAHWKSQPELDSRMWLTWISPAFSRLPVPCCFLTSCSSLSGLSGEPAQQESGVIGSWREENNLSRGIILTSSKLTLWLLVPLPSMRVSEVEAGVGGSVLSSGWYVVVVSPSPDAPVSTLLSRCCSSTIFFRYLPWASILSCSCLWTYKNSES